MPPRPHPELPSENLAQNALSDSNLNPLYEAHRMCFDDLLRQGYKKEHLYNKLYPCKNQSIVEGCHTHKDYGHCSRDHGIVAVLFMATAALLKWGFKNHRLVRARMKDLGDLGQPPLMDICIVWALRNLLANGRYGTCEVSPPFSYPR